MKKLIVLIPLLCFLGFTQKANATFNVPSGTYYFDNSQTQWSNVYLFIGHGSYVISYQMSLSSTADVYSYNLGSAWNGASGFYVANNSGGVTAGSGSYNINTAPGSLPSSIPTSWTSVQGSAPTAGQIFVPWVSSGTGINIGWATTLNAPTNVLNGTDVMFYINQSYAGSLGITNNSSSTCISTVQNQQFNSNTDNYVEMAASNIPSTLSITNNCGGWSGTGGFSSQTSANAAGARYQTGSPSSKTNATSFSTSASSTSIVSGTASINMTATTGATTSSYGRKMYVQYYVDGTLSITSPQISSTTTITALTTSGLSVGSHTIVPVITDRLIYYTASSITLTVTNPPSITVTGSLTAFTSCVGSQSSQQSFTVAGSNLSGNLIVTPPTGYQISQTNGSGYSSSAINLSPSGGSVGTTTIYTVFVPATSGAINGNITVATTGATTQNVAASGTGNALPAISANPTNPAAVGSGAGTAAFSVTASGASITYQWQEYISSWNNISNGGVYSGATTSTLTLTNATSSTNGYQYRCVVSGTCSPAATSTAATLTVTSNTITTGTISGSPFCAGASVTVPFTYSTAVSFPSGTSTFTAQLSPDNTFASPTSIGTVASNASGSQSISATIPSGTTTGTTYYIRVVSTSPTVSGATNGTALTINGLPTITASPSTSVQTVCVGGTLTALSVTASGAGLNYQWYYNASNSNSGGTIVSTGTGYSTASFTPSNSTASAYYYYCVVGGACTPNVTSGVSGLITVQTSSVGGTASASAICTGNTGTVTLSGNTGSIQWQSSSDNSTWASVSGGSGATSTSYTTASLSSGLYYRASVTNGACIAATSNVVSVTTNQSNASSSWNSGDNDNSTGFGAWTLSNTANSGFFTASSGKIDVNGYAWGLWANNGGLASAVRPLTSPMSVGQTLNFSMLSGAVQSGASEGFSLYNASGNPLMEFYFSGGSTNYTIHDNSGTPATTIGYTTNGMNVGLTYTSASGQGTYALAITIGSTTYNYTGTFISQSSEVPAQIRLYNSNAGNGSSYDFFVNSLSLNKPVINTQPVATTQNAYVNGTPTPLTVAANGTGLSYQWYSNATSSNSGGSLISGATSSSYSPPTSVAGTTYFYCVVTGTCATTTSNVSGAFIVSNNPPTITSFSTANNNGTTTSGYVGTTVTITGTNLASASALTVGGTSVSIISNTATSITFKAIAGINGAISVTVGGAVGTSTGTNYADLGYISTGGGNWSSTSTWLGGAVPNSTTEPVTIAASNSVTLDGAENVSSLTINSGGTFNNGTAQTLTINGGGALTNNGTFTSSTGTISFANGGTVSGTVSLNNLTIAGAAVALSSATTVNGTLLLNNGGYITTNSPIYGSSSTLDYGFTGTSGTPHSFTQYLEWPATSGPVNVTVNGAYEVISLGANRSLTGNLTVTNGTFGASGSDTLTMSGTTQTITISTTSGGVILGTDNGVGNDLTLMVNNGSTTTLTGDATGSGDNEKKFFGITVNTGGTLALGRGVLCKYGTFKVNGTLQINANGYVQATGGVAASYSSGNLVYSNGGPYTTTDYEWPTTNSPKNVTIQTASSNITLNGAKTISGALTLTNGTLTVAANTLTLSGSVSVASGVTDASNGSATVTFGNGSSISLPATTFTGNINNLTMNGAGGVTLNASLTIAGALTLTNGIITTNSHALTVSNTSNTAISGGTSTSYINGALTWYLPSGGSSNTYTFPVGASSYLPFTLASPTGTGALTATVQAFSTSSGGTASGTLSSISTSEYWSLSTTGTFTGTGTTVSLTRQTAVSLYNAIGASTTANGSYSSLGGSVSTYSVGPSSSIGSNKYFVFGSLASSPTVTSITTNSPISGETALGNGYFGQTVAIVGTGFISGATVSFNGTNASSVTFNSATSLTATIPNGATTGSITVTNPNTLLGTSPSFNILGYLSVNASGWNTGSTWLGGVVPAANSNVTINSAVTVTGAVTNAASTVTINSGNSLTLSSSGALNASTVVNNGTLDISAGTLTIAASGTLTNNTSGTSFSGGTVAFSGSATVDGTHPITFNNLTLGGGATLTTVPTITGTLTLNSGAYVTASPTFSGNTTLNYNNGGGSGAKFNQSSEWPSTAGPANVVITNNTWVQLTRNSSLSGDLTVTNGALQATGGSAKVLTMNGTTQTITISTTTGGAIYGTDNGFGNDISLTIANGSTTTLTGDASTSGDDEKKFLNITVNSGGTLALSRGVLCKYGAFSVAGTLQINSNGYVQSASGVAASYSLGNLVYGNGGPYTSTGYEWPTTGAPTNVTIQTASTNVTLNGSKTIVGKLTLSNGTLTVGANTLTLSDTIVRTSGVIDASNASATLAFTNTSAISLPSGLFSGNVNNLTLNGVGGVTIGSAINVDGTLTLTTGKLTLGNNNLTVGTISGGNSSNYIVTNGTGTVTKTAISANQVLPIGTATYYAPLQFATASSNNITAAASGSFTHTPAVANNTVGLQWSILASGAYTSNVTFQYNAANKGSGYTATGAILGVYSGSAYAESALGTVSGSGPYTVTASSLVVPTGSASLYGIGNPYSFLMTVPDAPTIGSVTRGNQQVTVAFTPPANNGGASITNYTATSSPSGLTGTGSSSPITVSGLTNGTAYTFTVTATSSVGTSAASSASASVTPATVPDTPVSITPTADNTQVYVAYTAPSGNGGSSVIDYTITAIPTSGSNIVRTGVTDNPYTFTGLSNGVTYTFTIAARNNVGTGTTITSIAAMPSSTTIWNGTTWSAGSPDSSQIAVITANYTSNTPLACSKLTVNPGITFNNNSTFTVSNTPVTINGSITGTGTVILNGTSAQTISGTGIIGNLTLNNTSGATINGSLGVTGVLNLQSGTLTTGGNLTLKSTSIVNSGVLGPIGVNGNNGTISGTVTVERYIPKGYRAYRDISANGVYNTSNSIFNTWQESGSYANNGYGMFITGTLDTTIKHNLVDETTGIDHSLSGYASAYYYKAGWNTITNTKTTALNPFQAYRVLVRGDRSFDLDTTPVIAIAGPTVLGMNNATTLRASGVPITGTVTFSTSGITNAVTGSTYNSSSYGLNNALNGYTYLANPYACPIVFDSIYNNSTNISPSYYFLDPTLSSTGSWVSYNALSHISSKSGLNSKYVQAGQGFLIGNNNSSSPVVVLNEAYKYVGSGARTAVFGANQNSSIGISLWFEYDTTYYNSGGNATIAFDSTFSNSVWGGDNVQFANANDNLAIVKGGTNLAIDAMKTATVKDTIPISLGQLSTTNYEFKIDASSYIGNGLIPYVYDKYLNITVKLNLDVNNVPFTADNSKPATYQNRFSIIFKPVSLPIRIITATATLSNSIATINWTTTGEVGVVNYQVEKSLDGKVFASIGNTPAQNKASASYSITDNKVTTIAIYYRIKAVNIDGTVAYSNVLLLTPNNSPFISVYPNPVLDKLNINLSRCFAGSTYFARVLTISGKEALIKSCVITTGNSLSLDASSLAGGSYILELTNSKGDKMVHEFIKK